MSWSEHRQPHFWSWTRSSSNQWRGSPTSACLCSRGHCSNNSSRRHKTSPWSWPQSRRSRSWGWWGSGAAVTTLLGPTKPHPAPAGRTSRSRGQSRLHRRLFQRFRMGSTGRPPCNMAVCKRLHGSQWVHALKFCLCSQAHFSIVYELIWKLVSNLR